MVGEGKQPNKLFGYLILTSFVLLVSLLVLFLVGQGQIVHAGSALYWAILLPPILAALLSFRSAAKFAISRGWLILGFLIGVFLASIAHNEIRPLLQIVLMVFVISWVASNARLPLEVFERVIALILVSGVAVWALGFNIWGILPGQTVDESAVSRVSLFPNVANTGVFAAVVFLICTQSKRSMQRLWWVALVAIYLLLFSAFRSGIIALAVYGLAMLVMNGIRLTPRLLFVTSLFLTAGVVATVFLIPPLLFSLQDVPLVSNLFLRGETNLTLDQLKTQMQRPLMWGSHMEMLLDNPLTGVGNEVFWARSYAESSGGSESLITRLLATYGLSALFFLAFMIERLYSSALRRDVWACAAFPAIFFLLLSYGSAFHPASPFFILAFMIICQGQEAFSGAHNFRRMKISKGLVAPT